MWRLLPCSLSWTLGTDCCTRWTTGILASSLFSCIHDMGLDRCHESAFRCTLGGTVTIDSVLLYYIHFVFGPVSIICSLKWSLPDVVYLIKKQLKETTPDFHSVWTFPLLLSTTS